MAIDKPEPVYIPPDGATVESDTTLATMSIATGAAAVGVAAVGAAEPVAFMVPTLLLTGEPGGVGLAAATTVAGLLPPDLYVPLFFFLGGLSVVLATINLIWGYQKKLRVQKIGLALMADPEFRDLMNKHYRAVHQTDFFSAEGERLIKAVPWWRFWRRTAA
jgi:hypothetical protein